MMTEACGATNCTMMEVGKAISMIKVCGANKSTLTLSRPYSLELCLTFRISFINHVISSKICKKYRNLTTKA